MTYQAHRDQRTEGGQKYRKDRSPSCLLAGGRADPAMGGGAGGGGPPPLMKPL